MLKSAPFRFALGLRPLSHLVLDPGPAAHELGQMLAQTGTSARRVRRGSGHRVGVLKG